MKNQPLKPWIKGNESITPNNFFSNALPNLEYGAWILQWNCIKRIL